MARAPLRFAALGILVCLLGSIGLLRWTVDPGQDLLVGRTSAVAVSNARYAQNFGADPVVVVFNAKNPVAFFTESNLARFEVVEEDLGHNPDVVSVTGPGTIAASAANAAKAFSNRVGTEYPLFVADDLATAAAQKGETDAAKLTQIYNDGYALAQRELLVDVLSATAHAEAARAAAQAHPAPTARILDSAESAADTAAGADMPVLFPQYLAGPTGTPDPAGAKQLFGRLTASYGLCDPLIAAALKQTASCLTFFQRTLLDLPRCPTYQDAQSAAAQGSAFCPPKTQWSAVFPNNGEQDAVLTVRLTAAAAADPVRARAVRDRIEALLGKGVAGINNDDYLNALKNGTASGTDATAAQQKQQYTERVTLGPLAPTECAGQPATSVCQKQYGNAVMPHVIAAASLLSGGVADSMTRSLLFLLPFVGLLMVIILLAVFRVRGAWRRVVPLLAASLATAAVVGISLAVGTALTPATLAGLPVLVGLGVDYAVQAVARFDEQRREVDRATALTTVLARTGAATAAAAAATVVGLSALAVASGIDAGPLTAVPLVAEFAVVVGFGVIVAWLASLFIALPLAAATDSRDAQETADATVEIPEATRTVALSQPRRLTPVLALAVVVALIGWVVLPQVRVETDPQRLLAPDLAELHAIQTVQVQLGYSNEVDIFVTGPVAGPYQGAADVPGNVIWLCQATSDVRSKYAGQITLATSIADVLTANGSSPNAQQCPTPLITPAGNAASTTTPPPQTTFLCDLRALPLLSSSLVMPIDPNVKPCLPIDKFRNVFVGTDKTPINPSATRIVVGVSNDVTTIAAEARLIDSLRSDFNAPQAQGLTATPAGLPVAAAAAYNAITSHALLFNLVPLLMVALLLGLLYREMRRALLPLLPTLLAAGWSPLLVLLLGLLPGDAGRTLGAFSPLTVVMGALVIALATEFGVVILSRFVEARRDGASPEDAAAIALASVGRAVRVSALTLAGGFVVLALSAFSGNGMPLLSGFGLSVVLDLGLAVLAVFGFMLPLAVYMERAKPQWMPTVVVPIFDAPAPKKAPSTTGAASKTRASAKTSAVSKTSAATKKTTTTAKPPAKTAAKPRAPRPPRAP